MKELRTCLVAAVTLCALLATPAPAQAVPPSNDDRADATRFSTLPYTVTTDTTEATVDTAPADHCITAARSVWYRFNPATTGRVVVSTAGSNYDTSLDVYRVNATGGLNHITCDGSSGPGDTAALDFTAKTGVVYYLMVTDRRVSGPGGTLKLTARRPITSTVRLDGPGRVDRVDGSVRVRGTVQCSRAAHTQVELRLRQRVSALFIATGFGRRRGIECGPEERRFRVRVQPSTNIAFKEGLARVNGASWDSCEFQDVGCVSGKFGRETLRLRMRKG